jgi:predicted ATPase/DNA-binding CsgD family transcriptional regulator
LPRHPHDLIDTTDDAESRPGNLPLHLTKLVGRDGALAELAPMLWDTRLLTLCGPGGAGKSRLALALAETVRDDFIGGAWWADLSSTEEPDRVAQAAAAALLPGMSITDPIAAISRLLSGSSLLVVDNCEQVVDSSSAVVIDLLARAPALRIIATSRQPLGIAGEYVWRVPGLAIEDDEPGGGGAGAPYPASIELFMQRARESAANFQPDARGARETVAEICRWLDGMPLAIELAAARASVLGVDLIAERLKSDVGFLRQSRRAAPGRHRTLHDTLEWSHQLLEPDEQRLFRRLSVFRGSFSLRAAEAVCPDELIPGEDVLELLSSLVDRSLVHVVDSGGRSRFRLLTTVRQYATQKLEASGERETTRGRHAEFYLGLGDRARVGLAGKDQVVWLEGLELDHDNLSEALEWLFDHAPAQAAELAFALWPFSYQHGYYDEARSWFERAVAASAQLPEPITIEALLKAGEVSFLQCDYAVASGHLERALELIGDAGEERLAAIALQRLGSIAREQGRYGESKTLHQRSLAIWEAVGDREGVAASQNYLAFVAWLGGDFPLASEAGARALQEFRSAGNLHDVATTLINLGASAMYAGELELAAERLEEALQISRRLGFQEGIAWSLNELAILARMRRHPGVDPRMMLRDALLVHQQLGDRWRIASVLEEIAGYGLERDDDARAAQLLGCAESLREQIGVPMPPVEAPDREQAVARLRRRLGANVFQAAWKEGREQDLEHAIDGAVAAIEQPHAGAADGDVQSLAPILTPREMAVLELLSRGQTNREIAGALFISTSTAGVHVSNILRKLHAKRRVDAATRAQALGLLEA